MILMLLWTKATLNECKKKWKKQNKPKQKLQILNSIKNGGLDEDHSMKSINMLVKSG